MNYLAHLALAPATNASRIGNLLGDFAKGSESSLRTNLPSDLVDGIILHRAIDKYTDQHPSFLAARPLLDPSRSRYAGVVIDIIFDHFLSIHWHNFYDQPLDEFIAEIYQTLHDHPEWQLGTLKTIFPRMQSQNWLGCYGTIEGMTDTFHRVSTRSRFTQPIKDTHLDLKQHYKAFEKHFLAIYPDLILFCQKH